MSHKTVPRAGLPIDNYGLEDSLDGTPAPDVEVAKKPYRSPSDFKKALTSQKLLKEDVVLEAPESTSWKLSAQDGLLTHLDANGDNVLTKEELITGVMQYQMQLKMAQQTKRIAILIAFLVPILCLAVLAMSYAVVIMTKDTSSENGKLVDTESGETLQCASAEFEIVGGTLVSRERSPGYDFGENITDDIDDDILTSSSARAALGVRAAYQQRTLSSSMPASFFKELVWLDIESPTGAHVSLKVQTVSYIPHNKAKCGAFLKLGTVSGTLVLDDVDIYYDDSASSFFQESGFLLFPSASNRRRLRNEKPKVIKIPATHHAATIHKELRKLDDSGFAVVGFFNSIDDLPWVCTSVEKPNLPDFYSAEIKLLQPCSRGDSASICSFKADNGKYYRSFGVELYEGEEYLMTTREIFVEPTATTVVEEVPFHPNVHVVKTSFANMSFLSYQAYDDGRHAHCFSQANKDLLMRLPDDFIFYPLNDLPEASDLRHFRISYLGSGLYTGVWRHMDFYDDKISHLPKILVSHDNDIIVFKTFLVGDDRKSFADSPLQLSQPDFQVCEFIATAVYKDEIADILNEGFSENTTDFRKYSIVGSWNFSTEYPPVVRTLGSYSEQDLNYYAQLYIDYDNGTHTAQNEWAAWALDFYELVYNEKVGNVVDPQAGRRLGFFKSISNAFKKVTQSFQVVYSGIPGSFANLLSDAYKESLSALGRATSLASMVSGSIASAAQAKLGVVVGGAGAYIREIEEVAEDPGSFITDVNIEDFADIAENVISEGIDFLESLIPEFVWTCAVSYFESYLIVQAINRHIEFAIVEKTPFVLPAELTFVLDNQDGKTTLSFVANGCYRSVFCVDGDISQAFDHYPAVETVSTSTTENKVSFSIALDGISDCLDGILGEVGIDLPNILSGFRIPIADSTYSFTPKYHPDEYVVNGVTFSEYTYNTFLMNVAFYTPCVAELAIVCVRLSVDFTLLQSSEKKVFQTIGNAEVRKQVFTDPGVIQLAGSIEVEIADHFFGGYHGVYGGVIFRDTWASVLSATRPESGCSGFIFSGRCYFVIDTTPASPSSARAACSIFSAFAVSIDSETLNNWIGDQFNQELVIGFDNAKSPIFHNPAIRQGYRKWAPDSAAASPNNCAKFVPGSNDWVALSCSTVVSAKPLCQNTACPPGWRSFENHCVALANDNKNTYGNALRACGRLNSVPVTVYNARYSNFIVDNFGADTYWLGYDKQSTDSKIWRYPRPSGAVNFWAPTHPKSMWCTRIKSDKNWISVSCNDNALPLCQWTPCPLRWIDWVGRCVRKTVGKGTFDQMTEACSTDGGEPVTIESDDFAQWITEAVGLGTSWDTGAFTGLRRPPGAALNDPSAYEWVSGSAASYRNIVSGTELEFGDCTTLFSGDLHAGACGAARPMVCQKIMCAPGWTAFGNKCVTATATAVTYAAAVTECAEKGATVATIQSVGLNKWLVENWADGYYLPGLSFWIGLSSVDSDEFWWDSGAFVDYVNWQSGQPNLSNDCTLMAADGKWSTAACTAQYYAICEVYGY